MCGHGGQACREHETAQQHEACGQLRRRTLCRHDALRASRNRQHNRSRRIAAWRRATAFYNPARRVVMPRASEMSKSVFLLVSLAASLMLSGSAAARAVPPSPRSWKPDIDELVARDARHRPPQHGVLFVGSSSIRFWAATLQQDFPGIPVIDRGFGGSAIADSTYYASRIIVPYH